MIQEEFELIIKNDETLNRLLNEKEIGVFANFSNKNFENEGFKKYIEKAYSESYKEIFNKNIGTSEEGKVTTLLRSVDYLATPEFKEEIFADLKVVLENAYEKLDSFRKLAQTNTNDSQLQLLAPLLDNSLNFVVIDIINKFGNNKSLQASKERIIACSLDICDLFSNVDPKNETYKYAIYNIVMNKLEKISDMSPLNDRYEVNKSRISKKRTGVEVKYYVGIALAILFVIIRIIIRSRR